MVGRGAPCRRIVRPGVTLHTPGGIGSLMFVELPDVWETVTTLA